jgi:hypothetical protein
MTEGALVDVAELLPTPAEIASPTAHVAGRPAGTGMSTATPAVGRRR